MNLRQRIALRLLGPVAKAASIQFLPNWVRDPLRDYSLAQLVKDGYLNSAVHAAIAVLADSFPEPPLDVARKTKGGDRVQMTGTLEKWMPGFPNPFMAEDEFWEFFITYAAIGGNCYVWKERDRSGLPIALWPFHDGLMRPIVDSRKWISHYELNVGDGRPVPVPKEDIIQWRWRVDPRTPQVGVSPIVAAARSVDLDTEAQRYVHALLYNDAVPRTVIKTRLGFNDAKLQQLKKQWEEQFGGGGRGGVGVLNDPDAEIMRVGANLEELATEALHNIPESRIAAVYGGAAIGFLAGFNVHLQRSIYANNEEAGVALYQRVLTPKWRSVSSTFTKSLAPEFTDDKSMVLDFDTSDVAAMQGIRRQNETHSLAMFTGGIWTLGEARAAIGRPPPTEDVILEQTSWRVMPVTSSAKAIIIDRPEPVEPMPPLLPAPPDDGQDDDGGSDNGNGRPVSPFAGMIGAKKAMTPAQRRKRQAEIEAEFERQIAHELEKAQRLAIHSNGSGG